MRRLAGLLLLIGCAGPAGGRDVAPAPARLDAVPRLAIVSAFDAELTALRAATTIEGRRVIDGRSYWLGTLRGQRVVLLLSGFSMVNAAMTTQALLDHFTVRGILFSGIAGGANPGLHVGDVTVPAAWAHYQEMVFARDTGGGYDPGPFAGEIAPFQFMYPRATSVIADPSRPDSLTRRLWFAADSSWLAVARSIGNDLTLRRCVDDGPCLTHAPQLVVGGRGVSGATFVDNATFREWVWRTFAADAIDMETAAVAIVAHHHRVPFIAFRSLSDLAGGSGAPNEMRTFGRIAAENSAAVVFRFLEALPRAAAPREVP